MKLKYKVFGLIAILLIILTILVFVWLNDYYEATEEVYEFLVSHDGVEVFTDELGYYTFKPNDAAEAIVFYPGGKVECIAYAPMLFSLAKLGYQVTLVSMPYNLAIFNSDAADGVRNQYPQISTWYLMGHSLGGSMAANHLSKNKDIYDGIILLGSYTNDSLVDYNGKILLVYGEHDYVLNRNKYNENKQNLPDGYLEYMIEGGNHAFFGYYGLQDHDGEATITREEQITQTLSYIETYLK